LQPIAGRADDACVHPAVAALALEEKGFVLAAALARMPAAEMEARVPGPAGARCAAALAALGEQERPTRAAEIAELTALARAPVPAGVERIHPDWLRERFEGAASAVVRAAVAELPDEVRAVAAEVLRARGAEGGPQGGELGPNAGAIGQRIVFAGLVPLAGAGGPATPVARELSALAAGELIRAIELRGAEALGRSLRGAPGDVVARAAAAIGDELAPVLLEAARAGGQGDAAPRDDARRLVEAAGAPAGGPGDAALGVGLHALAAILADEGGAALLAVAQRLPLALGRRLLAAGRDE